MLTMKITLFQTDIIWGDPDRNIVAADRLFDAAPSSDLYVLPEMWSTGFMTNCHVKPQDKALEWMKSKAQSHRAAVCGSLAMPLDSGKNANRLFFAKPDGTVDFYDKRHLFSYGKEDLFFSKGNRRVIVEYGGIRFLLTTCYDLRCPVWARCRKDYDAMICVANWPDSRQNVWDTLLRARAIENQCYVIGCNRTGNDPSCHYEGHSALIDFYGKAIAESKSDTEHVLTAEIDIDQLNHFRKKFPALEDMDSFTLDIG